MATNPYDVMIPLLQRMHGLAGQLGTDVAWVNKEAYDLLVLNTMVSSVILRIIQKIHPTVATDAALLAEFDHALDLLAGQDWNNVTQRIALLGNDPNVNPWM